MTENLKKMIPLLTVSGSPLVAGKQAAAAAGGGGSTDHIPRPSDGNARPSLGSSVLNPVLQINAVSDKGLAQRQEMVIKQQDAMISDIEAGVDRLHARALEIGEEGAWVLLLFLCFASPLLRLCFCSVAFSASSRLVWLVLVLCCRCR